VDHRIYLNSAKERRANDMTFIVSQAMRSLFHPPLNLYR
jgi:hypothetical protein